MIQLVEVGPRDGLQSEEAVLGVADRVALIRRLAAAGATRIETCSFAHPRRVPQMAGAEEVCAALAERGFSAIGLVLNERGAERALATDVDEINLVAYASDGYAERNTGAAAAERNAEAEALIPGIVDAGRSCSVTIAVAFGDPITGPVADSNLVALAAGFAEAGASEIALGDTIGVASPGDVERVVPLVKEAIGGAGLRCHFHNTRNRGYANAIAALRSGADALDSSVGGFGGSPFSPGAGGNIATEDLVDMLDRMEVATGVDAAAMADTGVWLAHALGHDEAPAMLGRAAPWP